MTFPAGGLADLPGILGVLAADLSLNFGWGTWVRRHYALGKAAVSYPRFRGFLGVCALGWKSQVVSY